jgi:hypothetical protein
MLKVNTEKISVEEFAVKYHLFPITDKTGYTTLTKGDGSIRVERKQNLVFVEAEVEYGDWKVTLDDETAGLLFDMIKNGDVIKEESA